MHKLHKFYNKFYNKLDICVHRLLFVQLRPAKQPTNTCVAPCPKERLEAHGINCRKTERKEGHHQILQEDRSKGCIMFHSIVGSQMLTSFCGIPQQQQQQQLLLLLLLLLFAAIGLSPSSSGYFTCKQT